MHRRNHFVTKSKRMPVQSSKMHNSKRVDIKTTDLSCFNNENRVKCAITQESVKYQNKLLMEMLFTQV